MSASDSDKTNVVITMAGLGSRFQKAGYKVPKYAIEVHGRTLFEWSMLSLANFIEEDTNLIFVCLKENSPQTFIRTQCEKFGYRNVRILELEALTDGQATSALLSREMWLPSRPLLIYNIDTYVNPRCLHPRDIKPGSDGWVPCFQVPGDHWSFVKVNGQGWATGVAEKRRISDNASIGLYWFANCDDYTAHYREFFSDPANLVKGERYVAPLYSHLIGQGKRVSISDLPVAEVHALGTPAELDLFRAQSQA